MALETLVVPERYLPHISKEATSKVIGFPEDFQPKTLVNPPLAAIATQTVERGCGHHQALVVTSTYRYEIRQIPTPTIEEPDEVMIETRAVGLNPIDWKSVDYKFCLPELPWVTGREMAGVVRKIGSQVKGLRPGDRVWTSTYYKKCKAGCFQQVVTVPQHTVLKIPAGISFESAASLGVPGLTAAMTLWHWLEVPFTAEKGRRKSGDFILIWGGSTITGQFAIQLALESGLSVVAVTSSKTASLVRSLGADHVVTRDDKTDEMIVEEVRNTVGDRLTRAVDIVGPKTAAMAVKALSTSLPSAIAPLSFLPQDFVPPANVTVRNVEMKRFILDPTSKVYAERLNCLLKKRQVDIPALEILPGGLAAIPDGLSRVKRGDMQGKKLIVKV
ncbi:hypothetical protein LTR93_004655 [Exophiala xenobiotica]|nr:hypothetical protein LTR93_004655 [Exophiala xenobiotica]